MEMTEKRKVRKDFDPRRSICVDVYSCTEEEKKEVQQAFFDVGIKWELEGASFHCLYANLYTNSTRVGPYTDHLMYGTSPRTDSISHRQFLELVYEPEQKGHIHAEMIALCAEFAQTMEDPMSMFQHWDEGEWHDLVKDANIAFYIHREYRRKPKTHTVHGVEVPDLRIAPKKGDRFYLVDPTEPEFTCNYSVTSVVECDTLWAERGLCYEPTEAGRQAAILHAKAWLGIA